MTDATPRTYYCQVDTHLATKDYQHHGRCVRLLAIEPSDYSEQALAEGVTTYTIDVDYWIFCTKVLGLKTSRSITRNHCSEIDRRDDAAALEPRWYRIKLFLNGGRDGYVYPTFSETPPQFFGIDDLEPLASGPTLPVTRATCHPTPEFQFELRSPDRHRCALTHGNQNYCFVFDSYHVGQGMCSLIHDSEAGILIDAGAGKPVTRARYISGKINNQLRSAVRNIRDLRAVISHADSDHWRLLAWDSTLRSSVSRIYVPSGTRSLAFQDMATIDKIVPVENVTWHLDHESSLQLLRSKPSMSDSNGECLVVLFERRDRRVLAPADYVYKRFGTDQNPGIRDLTRRSFSAVVVPHHGDEASATGIFSAAEDAKAFFSAGTHQGYRHPTQESLDAHSAAKYRVISSPKLSDIKAKRLL